MDEEKFFELVSRVAKSLDLSSKEQIIDEFSRVNLKLEPAAADDLTSLIVAIRAFQATNWISVGAKADRWAQLTGATKLLFEHYCERSVPKEDWQGFQYVIGQ